MCTVLKATHAETSAQEDYEATDLVLGIGTISASSIVLLYMGRVAAVSLKRV